MSWGLKSSSMNWLSNQVQTTSSNTCRVHGQGWATCTARTAQYVVVAAGTLHGARCAGLWPGLAQAFQMLVSGSEANLESFVLSNALSLQSLVLQQNACVKTSCSFQLSTSDANAACQTKT